MEQLLLIHSTNEVIIGKTEAQSLNITVGDTINLYGKDFNITGTFETGNFITDTWHNDATFNITESNKQRQQGQRHTCEGH